VQVRAAQLRQFPPEWFRGGGDAVRLTGSGQQDGKAMPARRCQGVADLPRPAVEGATRHYRRPAEDDRTPTRNPASDVRRAPQAPVHRVATTAAEWQLTARGTTPRRGRPKQSVHGTPSWTGCNGRSGEIQNIRNRRGPCGWHGPRLIFCPWPMVKGRNASGRGPQMFDATSRL
jgi:hypothetical protein